MYCEWPLTTNTTDSEELLWLAEEADVRHLIGLQRTVGASSLQLEELISSRYAGDLRSVRIHVSMSGFGPVRSKSLGWTLRAANFPHVLSIYGGHFMDMLFHAVGKTATLNVVVRTQFTEVSIEADPRVLNETPDAVMVMGTLKNGATNADEILVHHARFLREQAETNEGKSATSFNKQWEVPQA